MTMTEIEDFKTFDRRERRYPLDLSLGTPEQQVKAALKAWRNPVKFQLWTFGDDAFSGRVLPVRSAFALDVRILAHRLPEPQRTIVRLYFLTPRPPHRRALTEADDDRCESCEQHYGNPQIARCLGMVDERGRPKSHSVAQYKQHAIAGIAANIWPAYFRRMAQRKMRV